ARERSELTSEYRLIRNSANRYMQDREAMKAKTFAGMGHGFQAHDAFATASQGTIQDRTDEHLVSSDKGIIAARKFLEDALGGVQEGRDAAHVAREHSQNRFPHLLVISDMIRNTSDWKDYTKALEQEARAKL